jgi:hypothetical protein
MQATNLIVYVLHWLCVEVIVFVISVIVALLQLLVGSQGVLDKEFGSGYPSDERCVKWYHTYPPKLQPPHHSTTAPHLS